MKNKVYLMFDYLLILVVTVLISIGILFIYSSSVNSDGISVTNEYIKQIIWAVIGLVIMISLTLYDYRLFEKIATYPGTVILVSHEKNFYDELKMIHINFY